MSNSLWTVSRLLQYIKQELTNDYILTDINIEGEIGNFTNHSSGHWYFTLKDNTGLINCCMFRGNNFKVHFLPKNGDKVVVKAAVNIFERSGQLQLVCSTMKLAGAGDFYAQFELMKKKLEPLGYFDLARKKEIPAYPKQISVVTGANTAALQDILITIHKRWPIVEVLQNNAIVQGQEAIESVVKALKIADSQHSDVIILARGGGSVDDLWCFNDEAIATAIYNCVTPVITGIGHEIDTTIADLVADKRAATPTAAAMAATPDQIEIKARLHKYEEILCSSVKNKYDNAAQELDYQYSKLLNYQTSIVTMRKKLQENELKLYNLNALRIQDYHYKLNLIQNNSLNLLNQFYLKKVNSYNQVITRLDLLSPLNTLKRGYTLTYQQGKLIKQAQEIDLNQDLDIQFSDGSITAKNLQRR